MLTIKIYLIVDVNLLKKSHVLQKIPLVTPYYEVSFEVKPLGEVTDWTSVIHLTTENNAEDFGSRTPAVFFKKGGSRLHICSSISLNRNYCWDAKHNLPFYQFSSIVIKQIAFEGDLLFGFL